MFTWLRALAVLFFPLPVLYTLVVYIRNRLYDWGWFRSYKIPATVISIGNIQLGGTGKTPLVQFLAETLNNEGLQPVILTRGYKRKSTRTIIINSANREHLTVDDVGDEPFLLSRNLPEVTIGVDADRRRAALQMLEANPEAIFILDDGFQHRQLRRDLDLVLVDCSRWSNLPFLFPLTQFRDVPSSLKRAQVIILTHSEDNLTKCKKLSRQLASRCQVPVFYGQYQAIELKGISEAINCSLDQLKNKNVAAFCGIAQPSTFFNMLSGLGGNICWRGVYRDHYSYQLKDVREIAHQAKTAGAEYIITTQKDAVKLAALKMPFTEPWFFLQVGFVVGERNEFTSFLKKHLPQFDPAANK